MSGDLENTSSYCCSSGSQMFLSGPGDNNEASIERMSFSDVLRVPKTNIVTIDAILADIAKGLRTLMLITS